MKTNDTYLVDQFNTFTDTQFQQFVEKAYGTLLFDEIDQGKASIVILSNPEISQGLNYYAYYTSIIFSEKILKESSILSAVSLARSTINDCFAFIDERDRQQVIDLIHWKIDLIIQNAVKIEYFEFAHNLYRFQQYLAKTHRPTK